MFPITLIHEYITDIWVVTPGKYIDTKGILK